MVHRASYDSYVYSNTLNQGKKNNRDACIMITALPRASMASGWLTASKLPESKKTSWTGESNVRGMAAIARSLLGMPIQLPLLTKFEPHLSPHSNLKRPQSQPLCRAPLRIWIPTPRPSMRGHDPAGKCFHAHLLSGFSLQSWAALNGHGFQDLPSTHM